MDKPIFDPTCGSKMCYFDKTNSKVVFGDIRSEEHILCDSRTLEISPDVILDFREIPFDDETFHLIIFDPPHLNRAGKTLGLL